jgi:hypothetical protein
MRYHKKFRHFKPETLTMTKVMLKDWSACNDSRKWIKMQEWTQKASNAYGIPMPVIVEDTAAGSGFYHLASNTIHMSKPSVVTVIHEFRHALQRHNKAKGFSYLENDVEPDARAWSLSLYYKVAPRSFRRLVEEGKIFHIEMSDLT